MIIEDVDYADFIKKEPLAKQYIKKLIGAAEFINNKKRWCLWLVGVSPADLRKMPLVMQRVEACKADPEQLSQMRDAVNWLSALRNLEKSIIQIPLW